MSIRQHKEDYPMPDFKDRLMRLLAFADKPIPGDLVRIKQSAKHKPWRGKEGVVKWVSTVRVEVEGVSRDLTPNSLENYRQ